MRFALLVGLALAAGCGKKDDDRDTRPWGERMDSIGPKTPPKPVRPPLTFEDGDFAKGYYENVVAADRKWLGKRGTIHFQIAGLGRHRDGRLYLSQEGIGGQTHNLYYYLADGQDDEFAKLKRGDVVALECTCDGRQNDGIDRTLIGYEFRVNFSDCVIVPAKK